jgi:hypothetical protein
MKSSATVVFLLGLLLAIQVSPAVAERQVIVEPITDILPGQISAGDAILQFTESCMLGNLNPPAYAITGFVAPPERYKLVFDPANGCSVCPLGVKINTIHVLLQAQVPCEIVMRVDVEAVAEEGDPNLDPDCPQSSPGAELCSSNWYSVGLPAAGLYDIALPIECDCLRMGSLYLLGFEFESSSCPSELDLITDESPTACTSWNNYGAGWIDVVSGYGLPGNLSVYADAECCTPPTQVDTRTWGELKSLYRK